MDISNLWSSDCLRGCWLCSKQENYSFLRAFQENVHQRNGRNTTGWKKWWTKKEILRGWKPEISPTKTEIKEEEWEPLWENTSGEERPGEIKRKSERVKPTRVINGGGRARNVNTKIKKVFRTETTHTVFQGRSEVKTFTFFFYSFIKTGSNLTKLMLVIDL